MMNLEQIAQQAMDYLDSVGVAADYYIKDGLLTLSTDGESHTFHLLFMPSYCDQNLVIKARVMTWCIALYPQKSPD